MSQSVTITSTSIDRYATVGRACMTAANAMIKQKDYDLAFKFQQLHDEANRKYSECMAKYLQKMYD